MSSITRTEQIYDYVYFIAEARGGDGRLVVKINGRDYDLLLARGQRVKLKGYIDAYAASDNIVVSWLPVEDVEHVDIAHNSEYLESIDTTLAGVKDRLPASLSANGNLRVAILEDAVGLATEATLSAVRSQLDITLSSLRDSLKPVRTAPTQDLSAYSVAAGGVAEIDKTGLDGWSAVVAIVRATYDAAATAGVRVRWLYSPDGVNYDSVEDAEAQGNYEDLTFAAGATRQRSIMIPILADNVRIQIVNLDASYPVTVDAWTLLMR